MKKEDIQIVVVQNTKLFPGGEKFEGFRLHEEEDFTSRILENFEYMRRGDAEINFEYKQPISYAVIVNEDGDIFAYQRGNKRTEYHETRLAGKWACGLGGHIEKEDEDSGNILEDSLLREIEEEVTIDGDIVDMKPIGYINSEAEEVSKVHIGILYMITTDANNISGSEEVINERFYKKSEIQDLLDDPEKNIETWTKIVFSHLLNS